MSIINKDLGMVTAYAYAVAGGYTGTEAEFEELLGNAAIILDNFENFSVEVTTLPAGSDATASYADGVLSLGIPKGDKGDKGDTGETGATGATPDLSIGTVTTLNAGDNATATISGTAEEPVLSLGIPKGPSGNTGVTAPLFSASSAYSKGDFVIYNDNLYTFTADHAAGAWTGSDATQTSAGSEISQLKEDFNDIYSETKVLIPFISGVYSWSRNDSRFIHTTNAKRASADIRSLNLQAGDVIGLTDYSTYNFAVGENGAGGGFYNGGYQSSDLTIPSGSTILPYMILVKRVDDADMTNADFEALSDQLHPANYTQSLNPDFVDDVSDALDYKPVKNNYVHLSFDDVSRCILNLANNGASFNSLWDEPFFGMMKRLHDTYGAIFSLYMWDVANIANIPDIFKSEISSASDWLKFGFHATLEGSLASATAQEAQQGYDTFITNIFAKCGGVNSVDRIPRLNYFAGNLNALKALRDCDCGCIGFLNTDDTRSAYYLTQEELTYLRTHSLWSDRTNGLQFVSTVMRLDWFVSGFSSEYNYNAPVENNPYDELVYRYGQPEMADLYSSLIVFTHEWQTYSANYVLDTAMVDRIEQVCQFANDYGYDFDYPQNRIPNITSAYIGEQTINNFVTTIKGEWSFGAVEDSGNIVPSTTRICTAPFKASKVVVDFPTGYKVNVCRYNSQTANSTSYVGRTNWKTTPQTVIGDYYYVIVASTTSDTATLDIADNYTITAVRNINDL